MKLGIDRKDTIIVTSDIIGREVYFTKFPNYTEVINHLTPGKKYLVIDHRAENLIYIDANNGKLIVVSLNFPCAHLNGMRFWYIAGRSRASQKLILTESGRAI